MGLEVRRMSGENEVLPENLEVDVWSQDRMYGSKCHSGRMVLSVRVDFIFTKPSHSSCFPYYRVILVEIRLIKGFLQIWRTWIVQNSQRHYLTQVSFNSHNACCYFSMHCTTILYTKKTCIFATLTTYVYFT